MATTDYAAAFVEFGRLADNPSGEEQEEKRRQQGFDLAVASILHAIAHATASNAWGSIATSFLGPDNTCSIDGPAGERAALMHRGMSSALTNRGRLYSTIRKIAHQGADDHDDSWGVRGLMVASLICVGSNPPSHLGAYQDLRNAGVTYQDLEWCHGLQDKLLHEGSLEERSLKLFEGVVWSCVYMSAGPAGDVQAEQARELLHKIRRECAASAHPRRQQIISDLQGVAVSVLEETAGYAGQVMISARPAMSTSLTNVFGDMLTLNVRPGGHRDVGEEMDESV